MKSMITLIAASLLGAATLEAQRPAPAPAPRTWASVYGQMYTSMSRVTDPGSSSHWIFDEPSWGVGTRLHREVSPGLLLGVDASFARPDYERRSVTLGTVVGTGTATVGTLMANGRFAYGGGRDLGVYLTGGVGTVAYNLEDLDAGWNADLALNAGTGIEYRFQRDMALALEWGRIWAYHEKEEIGGGSQQHSVLKLALRFGF